MNEALTASTWHLTLQKIRHTRGYDDTTRMLATMLYDILQAENIAQVAGVFDFHASKILEDTP